MSNRIDEAITRLAEADYPPEFWRMQYDIIQVATAYREQKSKIARLQNKCDNLELEAKIQAQEMRTYRAIVRNCYQIVTEATGEPGTWHGAEPVRKLATAYREQQELLRVAREALRATDKSLENLNYEPGCAVRLRINEALKGDQNERT